MRSVEVKVRVGRRRNEVANRDCEIQMQTAKKDRAGTRRQETQRQSRQKERGLKDGKEHSLSLSLQKQITNQQVLNRTSFGSQTWMEIIFGLPS